MMRNQRKWEDLNHSDVIPLHVGRGDALRTCRLYKAFGRTLAVDHVDLAVPPGALFGLVGPNGAGKTTELSMAVGLLRPDAGSVRVFGVDVWADPVRAKAMVGALPDGLSVPERLTGGELLHYTGRLRGLPADTVAERVSELLDVLELRDAEHALVIDYCPQRYAPCHPAGARSPWARPPEPPGP